MQHTINARRGAHAASTAALQRTPSVAAAWLATAGDHCMGDQVGVLSGSATAAATDGV